MAIRLNRFESQDKPQCAFFLEPLVIDSLGAEYLISILRSNDYSVNVYFDESGFMPWHSSGENSAGYNKLDSAITHDKIDVFFMSVSTDYFQRAISITRFLKIRYPEMVICIGGAHATYAHTNVLQEDSVDYACRGEGEIAILQLLLFLEGKSTSLPSGIYYNNGGRIEGEGFGELVRDLDALPFPDKSDYYAAIPQVRSLYSITTGRGCYNSCTFCNSKTYRDYYRKTGEEVCRRRSVSNVMTELKRAKEMYRPDFFFICDDSFMYDRNFLDEFATRYSAEIDMPFFCQTRPNFHDKAILSKLAKAGMFHVEVGVQSLNEKTRKKIFMRPESTADIVSAIALYKSLGVYTAVDHIVNPWDDAASLRSQIEQYIEIQPSWINVFYLMCYPGTEIIESAVRDGYLSVAEKDKIYNGKIELNYFQGGTVPLETLNAQKELIVFLCFIPILPKSVLRFIIKHNLLRFFRLLPMSTMLPVRFFNALFRKGDFMGRLHIKNMLKKMMILQRSIGLERKNEIAKIAGDWSVHSK